MIEPTPQATQLTEFLKAHSKRFFQEHAAIYMVSQLMTFVPDENRDVLFKETRDHVRKLVTTDEFNLGLDVYNIIDEAITEIEQAFKRNP